MKHIIPALAGAALIALVGAATAQNYPRSVQMPMMPDPGYPASVMMDDGSSSDFPIHTASDFGADRLNQQVRAMNESMIVMPPPPPYAGVPLR